MLYEFDPASFNMLASGNMHMLSRDRFLRNNLVVFVGSLCISILSYLYYPVLARVMSFNDFGEVQTLVSIFNQAALIFSAINIVTVVLVSSDKPSKQNEHFILELQKLTIYAVALIGAVAILISPWLKSFFNFDSIWPFAAVVLALLANVPIVFWTSYLQGKENFTAMNTLGILGAGGKLIMSTALVGVGLGSFGAILGLFIGQVLALWVVMRRYDLPSLRALFKQKLPNWRVLSLEIKYTGLVFFVSLMITLLYSGDILLVKHFQNPNEAGGYAGIASIARIIFFLTLPFAMVLLPSIHSNLSQRLVVLKKNP